MYRKFIISISLVLFLASCSSDMSLDEVHAQIPSIRYDTPVMVQVWPKLKTAGELQTFLKTGVDPNTETNGIFPINSIGHPIGRAHDNSATERIQMLAALEILLQGGASPYLLDVRDLYGKNNEHIAEVYALLLKYGFNPAIPLGKQARYATMDAAWLPTPVLQLMLERGAPTNKADAAGYTPLIELAANIYKCGDGEYSVTRDRMYRNMVLLLQYGADPVRQGPGGLRAIDYLNEPLTKPYHQKFERLLLQYGSPLRQTPQNMGGEPEIINLNTLE